MKEADIRKWHRAAGMIFLLFVLLQVLTGLILTVENILGEYWGGILHDIHEGYGAVGHVYRIVVGAGLLWMAVSGALIYMAVRVRMKRR